MIIVRMWCTCVPGDGDMLVRALRVVITWGAPQGGDHVRGTAVW